MKTARTSPKTCSSLAALAALSIAGSAQASSHREAPAISIDPSADNTDVYAWVTPGTHDKLYIVANWIPLEEPAGGPNFYQFDDDVRYEIHIARGPMLAGATGALSISTVDLRPSTFVIL